MRIRLLASLSLAMLAAACVPRAAPPPPAAPRPAPPPPAAVPAPPPPPRSADWRDWPLTPGDWRYLRDARGTSAVFGGGVVTLRCERPAVTLTIGGAATPSAVIRTSALSRTLALTPAAEGAVARLPARDPLLDAMGFSRGRFIVERPGAPTLVIPAWAEVLRIVEDCR